MKKYFFLFLLIPIIGFAQERTVLTANRLFARNDKSVEFEVNLANHVQKYHTGEFKWRVWSILSGPDAGGFMITEGPSTWAILDSRGDLGQEHTIDWENKVLPNTFGQGQRGYYDFLADLSTVTLTDWADKILINHVIAKPGKIGKLHDLIGKLKKVWEAGKESVAVYSIAFSGEPGFIYSTRLKEGMKELASDYRKPLADRYNEVYGAGSFDSWLKDYEDIVQSRWSEILAFMPKMSSK